MPGRKSGSSTRTRSSNAGQPADCASTPHALQRSALGGPLGDRVEPFGQRLEIVVELVGVDVEIHRYLRVAEQPLQRYDVRSGPS